MDIPASPGSSGSPGKPRAEQILSDPPNQGPVASSAEVQAANQQVPDDLLKKYDAARDRFHRKRKALEEMIASDEYRHQERLNASAEDLRKAEEEVEKADTEIRKFLKKEDKVFGEGTSG